MLILFGSGRQYCVAPTCTSWCLVCKLAVLSRSHDFFLCLPPTLCCQGHVHWESEPPGRHGAQFCSIRRNLLCGGRDPSAQHWKRRKESHEAQVAFFLTLAKLMVYAFNRPLQPYDINVLFLRAKVHVPHFTNQEARQGSDGVSVGASVL